MYVYIFNTFLYIHTHIKCSCMFFVCILYCVCVVVKLCVSMYGKNKKINCIVKKNIQLFLLERTFIFLKIYLNFYIFLLYFFLNCRHLRGKNMNFRAPYLWEFFYWICYCFTLLQMIHKQCFFACDSRKINKYQS